MYICSHDTSSTEDPYLRSRSYSMKHASRRQVLGATATGTALSLAGCSALDDDEAVPDAEESDGTATVAVDIDDEMDEREAEIQQQLEDEEISQEEAQAEFQEAQVEALENAVAAVESYAANIDGLDVLETSDQAGALLVDGDPAAMIEALDTDDVGALVSAARFEQFREQPDGE